MKGARLPAPDSSEAILTYITKIFLCAFPSFSLCFSIRAVPSLPASSLVYVEISKIRKYLLGKKKKDQKIYLLLSPRRLFLHAFIGFASVGNREKKNVRNPELEKWQISFNASEAVLHNFKDNYKQKMFFPRPRRICQRATKRTWNRSLSLGVFIVLIFNMTKFMFLSFLSLSVNICGHLIEVPGQISLRAHPRV